MSRKFDQLMAAGLFADAERLARTRAREAIERWDEFHPRAISYVIRAARALCHQNKQKEAREIYELALENMLRVSCPDGRRVENLMEEIAPLYRTDMFDTVSKDGIHALFSNAVSQFERGMEEAHPRIAKALTIWAAFCWRTGELDKAVSLCERAESIFEGKCREIRGLIRTIRRDQNRE